MLATKGTKMTYIDKSKSLKNEISGNTIIMDTTDENGPIGLNFKPSPKEDYMQQQFDIHYCSMAGLTKTPNEMGFDEGWHGQFWYFTGQETDAEGYDVEGKTADFQTYPKTITYANTAAFTDLVANFPESHFAAMFQGKIRIEQPGEYTFSSKSADGSRIWVGHNKLVDNWGLHSTTRVEAKTTL